MAKEHNRILVLAPHTDDAELGCGGAIAKFIEEGKEIFLMNFSIALIPGKNFNTTQDKENIKKESLAAAAVLGVKKENLFFYDYQVRTFGQARQNILDDMIKIRGQIKPNLIFMPSLNDFHQDHYVVSREGLRAFKHASILGYEEPWNTVESKVNFFIRVEENHLQKKIAALDQYKSQTGRKFLEGKKIKSLAVVRGLQADTEYAEAFEVVRLIS